MTIEELKRIKENLNMSSAEIAKRSGVPFPTVHKIFCGVTRKPRHETMVKIQDALRSEYLPARYFDHPVPGAPAYLAGDAAEENASYVSDVELAYKGYGEEKGDKKKSLNRYPRQRYYTVDDYYAMPDEKRVELIDGVIYDMTAPLTSHQTIILQIALQMAPCEESHKGCQVFISPVDVQLDKDDRTMVQPDLAVVCDSDIVTEKCIYGAPDLVMEVLSESTRKRDLFIKLGKYCNAGCREYWIVDPKDMGITVYDFEHDGDIKHYSFDDKVPVNISNGDCEIDFSAIKKRLK